jgi:hypothetical protein
MTMIDESTCRNPHDRAHTGGGTGDTDCAKVPVVGGDGGAKSPPAAAKDIYVHKISDIKGAIYNNGLIEEKLHVIVVISNPCMYETRFRLFKDFIRRIELEEDEVELYLVEMIYPNQKFTMTDKANKMHLQIAAPVPLWHKENMINLAVRYLLPPTYRAFAWIDADVEFENCTWAVDALRILNGAKDVIQLFSHCIDMDKDGTTLNQFHSFGYSFNKNKLYTIKKADYWHPGYAWAMTRRAYEKLGGIYDKGILGSGDSVMALSFINKVSMATNKGFSAEYNNSMLEYQRRARKLRLGYVPGVIRHHYHGTKQNRRYTERWKILIDNKFVPSQHICFTDSGVLVPTVEFTDKFAADIMNYFIERHEDD